MYKIRIILDSKEDVIRTILVDNNQKTNMNKVGIICTVITVEIKGYVYRSFFPRQKYLLYK